MQQKCIIVNNFYVINRFLSERKKENKKFFAR